MTAFREPTMGREKGPSSLESPGLRWACGPSGRAVARPSGDPGGLLPLGPHRRTQGKHWSLRSLPEPSSTWRLLLAHGAEECIKHQTAPAKEPLPLGTALPFIRVMIFPWRSRPLGRPLLHLTQARLTHKQLPLGSPADPRGQHPAVKDAVQLVHDPEERGLLDVIVLSNNSPEAGSRIVHCARQAGYEQKPQMTAFQRWTGPQLPS
uniref:Uncharacterized protein LOC110197186 n=1 Tax=Phascolarctos cinereus TaxID=38626 RepID=A0A6P5J6B3_PHACI|nr:uncharacterized protein LOC110197186 [Phascolarctos cinereus]